MLKDNVRHIPISEFKANCLEIMRAVEQRKLPRVIVTRRGKPVAELSAMPSATSGLHGCLKGRAKGPPGFDLTKPILDVPWDPPRV